MDDAGIQRQSFTGMMRLLSDLASLGTSGSICPDDMLRISACRYLPDDFK